jgi:RHS repeat-associated protein
LQYFDLMPAENNLGVYQFNGKEKDDETGYNYYGARDYDSEKISWLSVDPMSDKYPSLSVLMFIVQIIL